jgi:antitoxin MazE
MGTLVKARIVKIGNSQGIRIPKPLLEQAGLDDLVEVEACDGELVVRAARSARAGWEEQFKAMAERGDDRLLDAGETPPTKWDQDEWAW